MANATLETLITLNHKGKSLKDISTITGMSWQQVWRLIHKDPRYKPGKRGFARLSKQNMREIASRGGKKANELGCTHRWNSKSAKAARKKV